VANLAEFAPGLTVPRLRALILERLFGSGDPARAPAFPLGAAEWAAVDALVAARYGNDAWTYGEDPPSDVARAVRTAAGELDVRLGVRGGRITAARVYGDFQGPRDVAELERLLVGAAYTREGVAAALAGVDVTAYFGAVTPEEVVGVVAG
jgi:lipoate-protein ligase A